MTERKLAELARPPLAWATTTTPANAGGVSGADHPGAGDELHPGCRFLPLRENDSTGRRPPGRHSVFQVQKNH
jgi:hypothetical protein